MLLKVHRALLPHAERSFAELDMCPSDFVLLEMLTAAEQTQLITVLKKLGTAAQRQLDRESEKEGA